MVGVMSLWTGTGKFQLTRSAMIIHTLAVCMANKAFKTTEFVTDTAGLEIADRLGWRYTNFVNALDRLCDAGMRHIWALGKLKAMSIQEAPFCHLDNDVILHKPLPEAFNTAELFAQSKDYPCHYQSKDMGEAMQMAGIPGHTVAFNAGIIGGNNVPLINGYATEAMSIAERFSGCEINGTTTSMVVEQSFFGAYARRNRVHVEELIPILASPSDLEDAGYTHLVGSSKTNPQYVDRCEQRLIRDFGEAYSSFQKGWKLIGGQS